MNTHKRYLALAATATIFIASLPLGAMKEQEIQKTRKINPRMLFLQAVNKQDLDYIKVHIGSMSSAILKTALDSLQDVQSEMYTFIANYMSTQSNTEKKHKRDNQPLMDVNPEEEKEIKKRKQDEETFLKAAQDDKIGIIFYNYKQMSDKIIQKATELTKKDGKVKLFLTTELNRRKIVKNEQDEKNETTNIIIQENMCPICLEDLYTIKNNISPSGSEPTVGLWCGKKISHDFHVSCLKEVATSLKKNNNTDLLCPKCRKPYPITIILKKEEIKKIEKLAFLIEKASLGENKVINYIIKNNKLVDSSSLDTIFENLSKRDRFKLLREKIDEGENTFDDNENIDLGFFKFEPTNREASPHANPIELFMKNSDVINNLNVLNIETAFKNTLEMLNIETYLAFVNNSTIFDKISLEPDIKKIFKAIAEEDDATFNEIFKNISTKNIDKQILAYILAFSACSNSLNIRQKALKEKNQFFLNNIDLNQLPFIISYAIEKDYKDVIQEIFSEQNKLLFIETAQEDLMPTLIAARDTEFFIIKYLYNTHIDLLKDTDRCYLYEQLYSAAKTGNLEIIKDFLDDKNSNLFEKTEKYHFHRAFVFAAKNGRTEIIEYFLNDKNITLFNGNCLICSLSEDSSTIPIKYENYLHEALIHTIKNNHKDIILILLHNNTIIDKLTKEALESALEVANTEEIKNEINKAIKEKINGPAISNNK